VLVPLRVPEGDSGNSAQFPNVAASKDSCVGEKSACAPHSPTGGADNRYESQTDKHLEETRMFRRTVIFFAVTIGLPVLTAIAIAWAR
jgi:hypothetical protein